MVIDELNDLFDSVRSGKIDVGVGGISASLERGKKVSFSKAYLKSSPGALVAKSILPPDNEGDVLLGKKLKNLLDLKEYAGLSFAVKEGTTNEWYVEKYFTKSEKTKYRNNDLALEALINNSCNVFIGDNYFIEALLLQKPELKAGYIPLIEPVMEQSIAVVIPKNDVKMFFDLDFFIYELKKTGTIRELKIKYFDNSEWIPSEK